MTKLPTSATPFHDMFLARITALDIMHPSSITLASHLAQDGVTKVPADKILFIGERLLAKVLEVKSVESPYVEQVLPMLLKANDGLKAQIAEYQRKGDLSDDTVLGRIDFESEAPFLGFSDKMTRTDAAEDGLQGKTPDTGADNIDPALATAAMHTDTLGLSNGLATTQ